MPRSAIRLALAVTLPGLTVPLSAQEIHQAVQAGELEGVVALLDADPLSLSGIRKTPVRGRTPLPQHPSRQPAAPALPYMTVLGRGPHP